MTHAKCESVAWQKVLVTVGVVTLCTSSVFAESSKIAKDLRKKLPSDQVYGDRTVHKSTNLQAAPKNIGQRRKAEAGTRACKGRLLFHSCFRNWHR